MTSLTESLREDLLKVMDRKNHWAWPHINEGRATRPQLLLHFQQEFDVYVRDFPVYLGGSLEAGNVWFRKQDVSTDELIFAGSVFLGVDSPLGPVYLGVGLGENSQRALYLQVGQLFD